MWKAVLVSVAGGIVGSVYARTEHSRGLKPGDFDDFVKMRRRFCGALALAGDLNARSLDWDPKRERQTNRSNPLLGTSSRWRLRWATRSSQTSEMGGIVEDLLLLRGPACVKTDVKKDFDTLTPGEKVPVLGDVFTGSGRVEKLNAWSDPLF